MFITVKPVETKVHTVDEIIEMIIGEDVAPKFKGNMFQGRSKKYPV